MSLRKSIQSYIEKGLVTGRRHPELPLTIYNYTPKVQYDSLWDEVTRICRGLILNDDGGVVARPFPKFFNYSEHQPEDMPNLPYKVYHKYDGSLGIMYWWEDRAYIATRGSFTSPQAIKANEILQRKYGDRLHELDQSATYLFEIIYPENRIVVDYKGQEDLVLLGVNRIGESVYHWQGETNIFPKAQCVTNVIHADGAKSSELVRENIVKLKTGDSLNKEGYVLHFQNGFRVKVKFDEYVELHRVVTGLSTRSIWEALQSGRDKDEFLSVIPDELYEWASNVADNLIGEYLDIMLGAAQVVKEAQNLPDRKSQALYIQANSKHPGICFSLLDSKIPEKQIWKLIKPEIETPYQKWLK